MSGGGKRPSGTGAGKLLYAGGRKVEIEQGDMSLSDVEEWRFCNVCSYMKRVSPTEKREVPGARSGFGDLGQKRSFFE
jgi:DEAD/DEAH box helicase domain-containing protein